MFKALIALSASELLLIDLKTGKHRILAPSKGKKAHANFAVFAKGDKSVLLVTDESGERAGIHRISVKDSKVEAFFYHAQAEVVRIRVAKQRNVLAVDLNAGSHSLFKLLYT